MQKMQKHEELLKEFETEFNKMRTELKFTPTLEELDDIFFLQDYVLQTGFVSKKLSRAICARIRDTFNGVIQLIQAWLSPNPYSVISITESQVFSDKEKEDLNTIMKEFLAFTSDNVIVGLTKDREKESQYITNSIALWNKHTQTLTSYVEKVNLRWKTPEKKNQY